MGVKVIIFVILSTMRRQAVEQLKMLLVRYISINQEKSKINRVLEQSHGFVQSLPNGHEHHMLEDIHISYPYLTFQLSLILTYTTKPV